jgi:hypothetical protein
MTGLSLAFRLIGLAARVAELVRRHEAGEDVIVALSFALRETVSAAEQLLRRVEAPREH